MDWLRELPSGVFWFGWAIVALLAGGLLYAVWWARRNAAAIAAETPVDVSDLSEGYRLAWGRTIGPDLRAPLTGRACVWWRVQVWQAARQREADGGHRWIWREIASEESDRPLLFGDGRAVAAVWPWGATAVIPSGWSDWRGKDLPPETRDPELRRGGAPAQGIRHDGLGPSGPRFRYVEQIIETDAPIFALGAVEHTDNGLYTPDTEDEADEAGERPITGEATAGARMPDRLGITPTPDAVVAADMARSDWTIGKAEGRPFLISTEHPDAVAAEQELGAKGGLMIGALFFALAAFLLWVRLG
jgi:hypothetical protein